MKYESLIFDCDGVILNSNAIKTLSFREALNAFNKNAIEEFINYHNQNGGISRYIKIKYFLEKILPKYDSDIHNYKNQYTKIIEMYSKYCKNYLYKCEITEGLKTLRKKTKDIKWFIVSGGDQEELREVFKYKNIDKLFNGGIYGSPDSKDQIIKRELDNQNIKYPALFMGDSKLDHIAALSNNIDFIFVTKWTEFKKYKDYCSKNNLKTVSKVFEICKFL